MTGLGFELFALFGVHCAHRLLYFLISYVENYKPSTFVSPNFPSCIDFSGFVYSINKILRNILKPKT